jgi:hypothetical protein
LPALSSAEASAYVSTDQYQALLARYTTAEGIRVIVVDAEDYEENALAYSQSATIAANEIASFTVKSLLFMGV